MVFSVALADVLAASGKTTREVGLLAGVSPSMVSHWTLGRHVPHPAQVFAIENGLGLPKGQLSQHLGYVPVSSGGQPPPPTLRALLEADEGLARHPELVEAALYVCRQLAKLGEKRTEAHDV